VAVRATFILVAQVAVGIDLDHHEIAVDGVQRARDAGRDRVLTAQPDQQLPGPQVFLGAGGDRRNHRLRAARNRRKRRERMDAIGERRLAIQLAVIQLDLARGLDNRSRPAPRS
jgi:hypothetical protein